MSEVNKNDQVQAMDIVEEDEETKQKRLVKETMNGKIIFFFLYKVLTCKIDMKRNFSLLERSVETIEARFTTRVLRTLPSIRRRLTSEILAQVIVDYYGPSK